MKLAACERRDRIRANHSATHLLHLGLRQVVGPHAMQKGSLVGPDRLRFDYSAAQPLTPEQIEKIEDIVNERVLQNAEVTTDVLPMNEAKQRGAIGIFEEKYGDVVRMLTIADSIELCGGTHVRRTGDIGAFKILSDTGLAAGVRRIKFHGLRHTTATLLLQAGVPPHVVQRRLGHKRIEITLGIYAHALPAQQQEAAERLAALLH